VLDAHYVDPRLVRVYDPISEIRDDVGFYVRLAGQHPKSVLDLGCGTGVLASALADAGHRVTGVDPAAEMLAVARGRDPRVAWHDGDARTLALAARFDLVVMTGHVLQVFLADADVTAVLTRAREHLLPDGVLAFETRNPAAREWERWTSDQTLRSVDVAGIGEVEWHSAVTGVREEYVSFETRYRFVATGEELTSTSTLRFLDEPALRAHLEAAGFGEIAIYGDWDRSPVTDSSPELIVIARR
jgi:SAM-dependent methyltransferase